MTTSELELQPTSAMSEQDLIHAGVGRRPDLDPTRTEACACGGLIRVEGDAAWPRIARVVRFHNQSTRHEQWAIAHGLR